ncbi:hypothetical protein ZWY2020_053931 [Hordeum vulgare]|nr:hypothetical protein ZWY2020_053931 [Hordeum vulgare]
MPSHPKGWGESWFYCQETSPKGENKLLGYREERLPTNFKLPDKLTEEEESDFSPVLSELRSLTNNGLTGIDLIRSWVEWRILPLSRRDGLMCELDGTLDHPQCYFHTTLTENDIVSIIKKLTGELLAKCGQIGLKPFCKINPAPKNSPPSSGDLVMPALPPMIRVPGAQAKNRKTGGSTSTTGPEPIEKPAPIQDNPAKDKSEDQADLPNSPKEGMETPNPPSPLKTAQDPDAVIITGTRFSKPASAVLSKHVSSSAQPSIEHEISKDKLSQYENLEFKELCSGFASRLEASYEMEKSVLLMMKNRHEESLAQAELAFGDLKKNLADQQDAREKSEEKYQIILSRMEKLKAALKKAQADQDVVVKRAEKAEAKLETVQQELADLNQHISNMAQAIFELKPEEVAAGFPQLKDDGSEFSQEDYQRVVKESRLAATQLVASLDLSKYQAAYDDKSKKVNPPTFVTTSLTLCRPKNPFDLEVDLSSVLNDEDEFAALSTCNWVLGDLQIEVGQSSKQADPGTSAE